MVEPVTTIIGGLAAARQAVNFLKQNVEVFNDAAEVGRQVGNILQGFDEFNKARNDPKMQAKLGIKDIASEMIEKRLLDEELEYLRSLLVSRFGASMWDEILQTRATRIREQKEAIKKAKAAQLKKRQELIGLLKALGIAIAIALTLGVALLVLLAKDMN